MYNEMLRYFYHFTWTKNPPQIRGKNSSVFCASQKTVENTITKCKFSIRGIYKLETVDYYGAANF